MAAACDLLLSDSHVILMWLFWPKSMKDSGLLSTLVSHTVQSTGVTADTIHKHCCAVVAALVTVVELLGVVELLIPISDPL